jgi:hypothetical protein
VVQQLISMPMLLPSQALGVKMVLSGEGSDEVFGGYLYFHKAPNRVGGWVGPGPSSWHSSSSGRTCTCGSSVARVDCMTWRRSLAWMLQIIVTRVLSGALSLFAVLLALAALLHPDFQSSLS